MTKLINYMQFLAPNPNLNFFTSKREALRENIKSKWLLSKMRYAIVLILFYGRNFYKIINYVLLGAESEFKLCNLKKVKLSEKMKKNWYFYKYAKIFQICFYKFNFDQTRYLHIFLAVVNDYEFSFWYLNIQILK